MADSPGRLLSSLSGGEGQLPPQVGGCVGVLMHLFDWNSRLQGKKFFSPKLLFTGCLYSSKRKKRYRATLPMAKLLLIADENYGGASSSEKASESIDSTATETNLSAEGVGWKRTPGIVARLMGLESLPAMELVRDDYVHLQSDNSDNTQESANADVKKASPLSSSRESKEDCYSMEGSSDGQIAQENNESILQVTATKKIAEKRCISENGNRHTDPNRQKNMHPSIAFDDSKLLIFSESNGNIEIQREKTDCEISIAEPNLSADKENQEEVIIEVEEGCEQSRDLRSGKRPRHSKVESAVSSTPVIRSHSKRKVERSKTVSTRRCSNKKLELDTQAEHRPLDFMKDRNAGEKKRRGLDPQPLSGFPSSSGTTGSVDMEVKAVSASPYKLRCRNADTVIQNDAQMSATSRNILQKEVDPADILLKKAVLPHLLKHSCVQMKMVNKCAPRTLNSMHPESPESLRSERDMSIKPKQQPSISAKRFLAAVEKRETPRAQGLRLTQRTAIIQKNSRPLKSVDMPFKRSAKPSLISEHLTQSSRTIFLGDKQAFGPHKELENRGKDQNKISKQPYKFQLKQDSILKRTFDRGMITSKGNGHNHNVPPQIGNNGNLPHKFSSISKPHSSSDLSYADKHLESNHLLDYQFHTMPIKMERMEHQPDMENPVCNLRSDTSSGKFEGRAAMRDDLINSCQIKTISQYSSELNRLDSHKCTSGVSSEECDCVHDDKHMVDGGAPNECSKGFSSVALNFCGKKVGDLWEDDCEKSLPWDNFRLIVNDDFGSPPSTKPQQQRMSVDQADTCETMSDSTCTEDSEHPSPVSVIDSPFQEGRLSRLRQDFQQKYHDTRMKMSPPSSRLSTSESLRQDNSSVSCEIGTIQIEQITEGSFSTFDASCSPILLMGIAENAEMDGNFDMEGYVKRAVIASGFQLENKKWPEDVTYPLRLRDWKYESLGTHQRLLFHCVNEALDLSLSQSVFSHGKMKQSHVNSTLTGEHIFDEVCNHMSGWQKLSLQAVDSVVNIEVSGADKAWRNLRQEELADITRITECMVFSDVIEELLLELMVLKV